MIEVAAPICVNMIVYLVSYLVDDLGGNEPFHGEIFSPLEKAFKLFLLK